MLIKRHPQQGARVVSSLDGYGPVAEIILAHHERIDGKGYPRGLAGDDIPELARIISVADTYDVMTARDSYRTPMSSYDAILELRRVAGKQLDARFVEVFIELLEGKDVSFQHGEAADFEKELALEARIAETASPGGEAQPLPGRRRQPTAETWRRRAVTRYAFARDARGHLPGTRARSGSRRSRIPRSARPTTRWSGSRRAGSAARTSTSTTAGCRSSRASRSGTSSSARCSPPGADVERVAVGDRVLGCFHTACATCASCLRGDYHRCERGQTFGHGANLGDLQGAQAEQLLVPRANLTLRRVPEGMSRRRRPLRRRRDGDRLPRVAHAGMQRRRHGRRARPRARSGSARCRRRSPAAPSRSSRSTRSQQRLAMAGDVRGHAAAPDRAGPEAGGPRRDRRARGRRRRRRGRRPGAAGAGGQPRPRRRHRLRDRRLRRQGRGAARASPG